ncbi:hypothetical protein OPU39_19655, partial [Acinetobacter nosocomialis]|nr:hypothetical protein [Acinetobacter nosocomialis]
RRSDYCGLICSLTASHVLTMTDAAHTLKINGTAEDTVGLGSGWTQSATNNGYVTYTSTVSGTAECRRSIYAKHTTIFMWRCTR